MTKPTTDEPNDLPSLGNLVEALLTYVEVACRDPMAPDDKPFVFDDMAMSTLESISSAMVQAGVFILEDPKFSFLKLGCPREEVAAVVEANAQATLCYWEVVEVSMQLLDLHFGDRSAGSRIRRRPNDPEPAEVAAGAKLFECLTRIGCCARDADGQMVWTDQCRLFADCHRPRKACSGAGCLAVGRMPKRADIRVAVSAPRQPD